MNKNSTNGQLALCLIGASMLIASPFVTHFFGFYTGAITCLSGVTLAVGFRGPQ